MNIDKIAQEGYFMQETKSNIGNLALVSLRNALKSYYSTYQSNQHGLRAIDKSKKRSGHSDDSYSIDYAENACSAITSFQHFSELILKDILRRSHNLLSVDAYDKPDILYDLLNGKMPSNSDLDQLKQVEASVALERVCALLKSKRIDFSIYGFVEKYRTFLSILNKLRNRILHRGIFVLKYEALDWFFGNHAFPFLKEVIALPEYGKFNVWRHRPLACGVNPIDEIVLSFNGGIYQLYKIAFIKELGRAAYQNPLWPGTDHKLKKYSWFDKEKVSLSESIAKQACLVSGGQEIKECPVCGIKSLVIDMDSFDEHDEKGDIIAVYPIPYKMHCYCCSFEIYHEFGELSTLGLPIDNLWGDD